MTSRTTDSMLHPSLSLSMRCRPLCESQSTLKRKQRPLVLKRRFRNRHVRTAQIVVAVTPAGDRHQMSRFADRHSIVPLQALHDPKQQAHAAALLIKASATTLEGTSPSENKLLIATVWMAGNRLRTTRSNSKPDMPGMFRSERRTSGTSLRISPKAEKPPSAIRTLYPILAST